jgi:hypothetical protein
MTTQEWLIIKRHIPNYFVCGYMWTGVVIGSLTGAILLDTILKMIGQ